MSRAVRHVLLDLDGTLTDSEEGIVRSMRHALLTMQRPVPDDAALRRLIGPPTHETFRRLLGTDDMGSIDEAVRLYRERYARVGLFENRLYPGVAEMLEALRMLDCTLFLATSKPIVYARRIVAHYGLTAHFAGLHGAEFDGTRADKTELIGHLLETERLDPEHCLMVGDRKHDILGARANGVRTCSARWGYGEPDEIRAAAPDFECFAAGELPTVVRMLIAQASS
ncbi:HAD hydrolase-like protein [Solimonas terrae]|uniref:HAD hydrolase-like protein n=1 Tax=Solimonas terrae TaxID=1396819 RepID=A0A6M2BP61_9GAMM|nr:HAD hydrolase-like protein [Solimonas terrae]NGY03859.1 HAD hydrolase-like protein [Solimonas terrae]